MAQLIHKSCGEGVIIWVDVNTCVCTSCRKHFQVVPLSEDKLKKGLTYLFMEAKTIEPEESS